MRFLVFTILLAAALPAAAYTRPLDLVRVDGADSALITTTPYLPIGQGDCSIYPFNYYGDCAHPAYDIGSAFGGEHLRGEPVRAAGDGIIAAINPDGFCGLDVFVDHQNGVFTRVCHLDGFADIAVGQFVSAGTVIGFLGSTGAGAPHLHFEARDGGLFGAYIDIGNPLDFAAFDSGPVEPGPCDSLDYFGRCTGSFLEWCDGGQYFTVECADRSQTCGVIDEAIGNDCIDAPVEEQPVEEQPVEEQPVEEQPVDEQPIDEQPVDEQPVDEQPVDEQPVADELGHALIERAPLPIERAREELPSSTSPSCAGAGAPWLVVLALILKRRRFTRPGQAPGQSHFRRQ